jgi:hypothetical protein
VCLGHRTELSRCASIRVSYVHMLARRMEMCLSRPLGSAATAPAVLGAEVLQGGGPAASASAGGTPAGNVAIRWWTSGFEAQSTASGLRPAVLSSTQLSAARSAYTCPFGGILAASTGSSAKRASGQLTVRSSLENGEALVVLDDGPRKAVERGQLGREAPLALVGSSCAVGAVAGRTVGTTRYRVGTAPFGQQYSQAGGRSGREVRRVQWSAQGLGAGLPMATRRPAATSHSAGHPKRASYVGMLGGGGKASHGSPGVVRVSR